MHIAIEELKKGKGYVTYSDGYRIVCYYEKYHEVLKGVHAKEIPDFMNNFKSNNKTPEFVSVEDVLSNFLSQKKDAKAVSIYNVNGEMLFKKNRNNHINQTDDSKVYIEELIYDYGEKNFDDGYRIVSFIDDNYSIGEYSKTLEGFMQGLAESYPILDEEDIPSFKSIDDILDRYLKLAPEIDGVAIYKTDGTCLAFKKRAINKLQ